MGKKVESRKEKMKENLETDLVPTILYLNPVHVIGKVKGSGFM